jgi:hypothetical protein
VVAMSATRYQLKHGLRYWLSIVSMETPRLLVPGSVLRALAVFAMRGLGYVTAPHSEIARMAGVDLATMARALDELEAQRFLFRGAGEQLWPCLDGEQNEARFFLLEYFELEEHLEANAGHACRVPHTDEPGVPNA